MRLHLFLPALFICSIVRAQDLDSISKSPDSLSVLPADTTAAISIDTVSIIGVGDIMMGTNYPEDKLPPNDGIHLLRNVESVLQDADVTFGNLEGTLLNYGGIPKKCKDPKVCYAFRTPVRYVKNLVNAGFDMMSLANNHAGDMGDRGKEKQHENIGQREHFTCGAGNASNGYF